LAQLNAIDVQAKVVKAEGASEHDTAATAMPDIKADEPQALHWMDDIIIDVTPVRVIQACQNVDQGQMLGDQRPFRDLKDPKEILNDDSKTIQERLNVGKGRLETFCAFFNFAQHRTAAIFAVYALMIGKFILALKAFITAARKKDKNIPLWGVWAAENLSFLGERRRQDYMALAERPDAFSYSFFGVERLLHLVRATEHISGPDKIGTFLAHNNITFDPGDEETKMHQFKCEVDVALAVEKAKDNEVILDPARVKKLIELGGEFDRKMLADCRQIVECGGDANLYLDARIQNRGKEVDYWVEEKLVTQVIAMSDRLVKGFGKVAADPNAAMKLEIAKIEPLEAVIARLKQVVSSLTPASGEGSTGSADSK